MVLLKKSSKTVARFTLPKNLLNFTQPLELLMIGSTVPKVAMDTLSNLAQMATLSMASFYPPAKSLK
jgi:hypothetical protein